MNALLIASLKEQAAEIPLLAAVYVKLHSHSAHSTKTGKPHLERIFADTTGNASHKV